jgi:hypothetical protein
MVLCSLLENRVQGTMSEENNTPHDDVMSWEEFGKMQKSLSGISVNGTIFISLEEMKEKNLNHKNFL